MSDIKLTIRGSRNGPFSALTYREDEGSVTHFLRSPAHMFAGDLKKCVTERLILPVCKAKNMKKDGPFCGTELFFLLKKCAC